MTNDELIQHANALHGNLTSGDRDVRNMPSKEQEWWIGGARAVLESAGVERLRKELSNAVERANSLYAQLDEWRGDNEKHRNALRCVRAELAETGTGNTRDEDLHEAVRALKKSRDEQKARADRAEQLEREFRAEVDGAFRRHGLAAGPRAVDGLVEQRDAEKARAERAECQLAGCGAAALGYGGECQKGDYGWTPAFDDIVSLRDKWLAEKARADTAEASRDASDRECEQYMTRIDALEKVVEAARQYVMRRTGFAMDDLRTEIGALEGELDAAKSDARFGHDLAKGRAERIRVACAELRKLAVVANVYTAEHLERIASELEGKDSPGEHPEKEQENGRNGTDDTGPRIPQPLVREEAGAECDDTDLSGDGRGADAAGAPSETGDAAGERGDGARRTRAPGGGGVHGQQVDSDSGQPASMSEQSRSESTHAGCSSPPTGGLLDSSVIRDLVTLALDMPNSIRFARSDEAYAAAQRLLARYPR